MSQCQPKLFRKRQLLLKLQPDCLAPTILANTDGKIRVKQGQNADPDVENNERDVARSTLTPLPDVMGAVMGKVSFSAEFAGSGDVTVEPAESEALQACGFRKINLTKIVIADFPENLFARDIVITDQATGTKTARLAQPILKYDKALFVEDVLSSFVDTDVLVVGATVIGTVSGAPTSGGFEFVPVSENFKRATVRSEEDGYKKEIFAAMGTVSITANSSKLASWEFEFQGPVLTDGKTIDCGALTGTGPIAKGATITSGAKVGELLREFTDGDGEVLYRIISGGAFVDTEVLSFGGGNSVTASSDSFESGFGSKPFTSGVPAVQYGTIPPTLTDANLLLEGYTPIFDAISFDVANEVIVRRDGNNRLGLISAAITGRKPVGTVDPEAMDESELHIYDSWFEGNLFPVQCMIGEDEGNRLWIFGKQAQYSGISDGDRDSVALDSAEFMLTGSVDNEIAFVFT